MWSSDILSCALNLRKREMMAEGNLRYRGMLLLALLGRAAGAAPMDDRS
jgi:hypothetical protein